MNAETKTAYRKVSKNRTVRISETNFEILLGRLVLFSVPIEAAANVVEANCLRTGRGIVR